VDGFDVGVDNAAGQATSHVNCRHKQSSSNEWR
jgi:hypothetical protein